MKSKLRIVKERSGNKILYIPEIYKKGFFSSGYWMKFFIGTKGELFHFNNCSDPELFADLQHAKDHIDEYNRLYDFDPIVWESENCKE